MAKNVVGLFETTADAQAALQDLRDSGFSQDDISFVANNASGEYDQYATDYSSGDSAAAEGAGAGAVGGAVLGGVGGLLVGLGLLTIPGIGPVAAAGWGAAAGTTALGAGIGALAGGLVGALVGAGIPEEDANVYAEGVRRGGTLLMVHTTDDRVEQAVDILNRHNVVDVDERGRLYREGGWTRFDENAGEYRTTDTTGYRTDVDAERTTGTYDSEGGATPDSDDYARSSKLGTATGGVAGAATGAAIGSAGGPVGTVVGGVAGALAGGGVGAAGDAIGAEATDDDTRRGDYDTTTRDTAYNETTDTASTGGMTGTAFGGQPYTNTATAGAGGTSDIDTSTTVADTTYDTTYTDTGRSDVDRGTTDRARTSDVDTTGSTYPRAADAGLPRSTAADAAGSSTVADTTYATDYADTGRAEAGTTSGGIDRVRVYDNTRSSNVAAGAGGTGAMYDDTGARADTDGGEYRGDTDDSIDRGDYERSSKVGTAAGGVAGAATGAAVGSAGGPVGTVVGGVAGAVTGGGVGAAGDAAGAEATDDDTRRTDDIDQRSASGTAYGSVTDTGTLGSTTTLPNTSDTGEKQVADTTYDTDYLDDTSSGSVNRSAGTGSLTDRAEGTTGLDIDRDGDVGNRSGNI